MLDVRIGVDDGASGQLKKEVRDSALVVAKEHADLYDVEIKVAPNVCLVATHCIRLTCKYVNASAFWHSALEVRRSHTVDDPKYRA